MANLSGYPDAALCPATGPHRLGIPFRLYLLQDQICCSGLSPQHRLATKEESEIFANIGFNLLTVLRIEKYSDNQLVSPNTSPEKRLVQGHIVNDIRTKTETTDPFLRDLLTCSWPGSTASCETWIQELVLRCRTCKFRRIIKWSRSHEGTVLRKEPREDMEPQ